MTEPSLIAQLVRETRQRRGLTQTQFAQKLGVSFQSVNCWERTMPLPMALKMIEGMVRQMGNHGRDLLVKYFPEE